MGKKEYKDIERKKRRSQRVNPANAVRDVQSTWNHPLVVLREEYTVFTAKEIGKEVKSEPLQPLSKAEPALGCPILGCLLTTAKTPFDF